MEQMNAMTWGLCMDSLTPLPVEGVKLMSEVFDTFRWEVYTVNGGGAPGVMVAPGQYDWTRTDADMNAFVRAGVRVLANIMWLPRWLTGGVPINEPYIATFRRPADNPAWLRPPFPSLASAEAIMYDFGVEFAKRYGHLIAFASVWNEAGGLDFFAQKDAPPSYLDALRPLYRYIVQAFMRGWRSVCPGVIFVGPDSESPGNLDLFLRLEVGMRDNMVPSIPYDILAFHAYPNRPYVPNTIERSLHEVGRPGGFLDVVSRYPSHAATPLWVAEFCDAPYPEQRDCTPAEWAAAILRTYPRITGLFPLLASQFVEGGAQAWDAGRFVGNKDFRDYAALRTHGPAAVARRRAARA